jgi:hypothetical protein
MNRPAPTTRYAGLAAPPSALTEPTEDEEIEHWRSDLRTRIRFYQADERIAQVQTWLLADIAECLHTMISEGRRRDAEQVERDKTTAKRDQQMQSLLPAMLAAMGIKTDVPEGRS